MNQTLSESTSTSLIKLSEVPAGGGVVVLTEIETVLEMEPHFVIIADLLWQPAFEEVYASRRVPLSLVWPKIPGR